MHAFVSNIFGKVAHPNTRLGRSIVAELDALKLSRILVDLRWRYTTVKLPTWGLDKVLQSAMPVYLGCVD